MAQPKTLLVRLLLLMCVLCSQSPIASADDKQELLALEKQYQFHDAAGRYSQAEPIARKMLVISERSFQDKPAVIAHCLNNLASLAYQQGRYAEAEPLYRRALAIYEKVHGKQHPDVADTLNNLAVLAADQGRYAEAEPLYGRALAIREKRLGKQHPDVASTLNNLAVLAKAQGRYAEAEPLYRRALAIYEKALGKQHPDVAMTLNNLGVLAKAQGRYAEAEPLYRRALAIYEKVLGKQHPDVAMTLNSLAGLAHHQGRYAEAEPLYGRALAIYEKVHGKQHPDVADTLNNLAVLAADQGRYAEAEPLYGRALVIYEKALGKQHPLVATTLNNLAVLAKAQGRYAEAEPLYGRALAIREKRLGKQHPDVASTLNNLAVLAADQGRYAEAEPLYRRALAIYEKALGKQHPDVADTLNNLAVLAADQGRYAEAEPLYRRALEIYEKSLGKQHPDVAMTLNNLAALAVDQGRYAEPEPLYRRALAIREKRLGKQHPDVAMTLNSLAGLAHHQGRYAEAEPLYGRALAIYEKVHGKQHPDVADTLNNLAGLAYRQGRYAEVEPLYRRALEIYEKSLGKQHPRVAMTLNNLAALAKEQGRYTEAKSLVERGIAIQDRADVAAADRWSSYQVRASIHWKLDRHDQAIGDLKHAMDLAEEQRTQGSGGDRQRAKLFAKFAGTYETMVAWQSELGDIGEALGAMERSRARSLQDQMALGRLDLLAGVSSKEAQALRERESKALSRISTIEKELKTARDNKQLSKQARQRKIDTLLGQLRQARTDYAQVYADIRNASPAYRLAVGQDRKPISLTKLQTWVAEQDGLLLEYLLGSKGSYVLVIPPEGPARLEKLTVGKEQAEALGIEPGLLTAKRLQQAFANKKETGVLQLLKASERTAQETNKLAALWNVLIPSDVQELLLADKVERLLVSPDGPLSLLPFEALVTRAGENVNYLLDAGPAIVYGPSGTILYNLAHRSDKLAGRRKPVLTVGDPNYSGVSSASISQFDASQPRSRYGSTGGRLDRLPFSGLESNWVSQVFGKYGVAVGQLQKADATEANVCFNISGRKLVHLACHGITDQRHGNLFGALALTPVRGYEANPAHDGFLTLAEIYGLNMKGCEMTILSACETNYGPQQRGEGVWALSRGFLVAGSRRVVASNWVVDDEAAADLISVYCDLIAKAEKDGGTVDYAEALREAKLWVRGQEKWKSPYYWSSFVLVGPR